MYTSLAYEAQKRAIGDQPRRLAGWRALLRKHAVRSSRGTRHAVAAVAFALIAWILLSASQALAAGGTLYVSHAASSDPACGSASQSNPFATIAGALRCKASPVNNTDQRNHNRNATTRLVCDTGAYDTGGN